MNLNKEAIDLLLENAKKAFDVGEIPVSAVIIDQANSIVAASYNNRQFSYNILGHAEILAVQKLEKKIKDWRLDGYKMIVTLEPCDLCARILYEARIDKVYYIIPKTDRNYNHFVDTEQAIVDDKIYEKFDNLLKSFFHNIR